MVFMSEKRNQRNYSLRQVQYSGRVAVMIMLVLNLTFAMFYRTASAQPSTIDTSIYTQGCQANALEMTPDMVALLARQKAIHDQLFQSQFSWCSGSFWTLDQDVSESDIVDDWSPVAITGQTMGGDNFAADVYYSVTIDWNGINLPLELQNLAQSISYNFRILGMQVFGPNGTTEIWGMVQSFTNPDTGEMTVLFMPNNEGEVVPLNLIQGSSRNCNDIKTQNQQCKCDAWEDYDTCRQRAIDALLMGAGVALGLGAIPAALFCIGGWAFGGPLGGIIACGLTALLRSSPAVLTGVGVFGLALNACQSDLDRDFGRCDRDFPLPTDPVPGG